MANINTHLDNLRQRPDHHKKRIAFGAAFAITLVVALVWVSTVSLTPKTQQQTTVSVDQNSPASVIGSNLANLWAGIKSVF
jgi:hypothetical protein